LWLENCFVYNASIENLFYWWIAKCKNLFACHTI
jgi:hypothetical protein